VRALPDTIPTRLWQAISLEQQGSGQNYINIESDNLSRECFTFTLQKGSLLRPVCALPLEVSQRESLANRFKLLLVSRGCTDNFLVHDNHMNVVRSHMLAT